MIDITKDIQSLTTFRRRSGDFMKQLYLHDPDGYNLCFQWPAEKQNR